MSSAAEPGEKRPRVGGPVKGQKYNRLPPMLMDVRWAYRNVATDKAGSGQQEKFRQLFRDKPEEFLSLMERLERQYKPPAKKAAPAKAPEPAPVAVPVEEDAGSEKALETARRWLQEWRLQGAPPPGP